MKRQYKIKHAIDLRKNCYRDSKYCSYEVCLTCQFTDVNSRECNVKTKKHYVVHYLKSLTDEDLLEALL